MPTKVITLPRSTLYNPVWTKPVGNFAKDFGNGNVALIKRRRSLKFPPP